MNEVHLDIDEYGDLYKDDEVKKAIYKEVFDIANSHMNVYLYSEKEVDVYYDKGYNNGINDAMHILHALGDNYKLVKREKE